MILAFGVARGVRGQISSRMLVLIEIQVSRNRPAPGGINLQKSKGIMEGSCVMFVIYGFINNRKEV